MKEKEYKVDSISTKLNSGSGSNLIIN